MRKYFIFVMISSVYQMKEMIQNRAAEIERLMIETRERTLALFNLTSEEHLRQSPGHGFRPIVWHLAHIGVFEAYWILQQLGGESPLDDQYERTFDPIKTPREESKNLPSRREMEGFLARVRDRTLSVLREYEPQADDPLLRDNYIFDLVLEHEYQHQETLAYLLQLLDQPKTAPPAIVKALAKSNVSAPHDMVSVAAGDFQMGSPWNCFAYDNELPAHVVNIPAYRIDRCLTTNQEYLEFIEASGYERRAWWSEEGWSWRERESWTSPRYWKQKGGVWLNRTMFAELELEPDHPVCGVSWYEAQAYANFRGKRLPTEAEWEKAASWDDRNQRKRRYSWGDDSPDKERCNFGYNLWGTTPVSMFPAGATAYGCLDMTGNVWEWTADKFRGFPGFRAFPYPEYSEVWFDDDHRVLKGGAWATQAPILRTSFRNFFRRHFRIAFAGFRLAQDV